jgi:RNA polymerase primary sigma factor
MATRGIKIAHTFTQHDAKSLGTYFKEINQTKIIDPDEEYKLALLAHGGNDKARELLVEVNLRFVVSVAKQYIQKGINLSDLVNEGNMGLIKAAQKFDHTRGYKFITYGVWWIRKSILAYIAVNATTVRLPNNRINDVTKVKKSIELFEGIEHRTPFEDELADMIPEMDIKAIKEAVRLISSTTSSLDIKDEDGLCMADIIVDEEFGVTDRAINEEDSENNINKILSVLSTKEADIIKSSLGIGCQKITLEEIGNKFEMSRENIRQIKTKGLKKLEKLLTRNESLYNMLLD